MAVVTPIIAPCEFNNAFLAYNSAHALRAHSHSDEEIERTEAVIDPLFDTLIASPARTNDEVISKCSAIMAEFGEGEVPAYLVETIMFDLIAMGYSR